MFNLVLVEIKLKEKNVEPLIILINIRQIFEILLRVMRSFKPVLSNKYSYKEHSTACNIISKQISEQTLVPSGP